MLAIATGSDKQDDQSLLAAFPLPSGFQRADTPLETLVAFLDQYGIDLDLGDEPTRLVIGGGAGMPYEEFTEWHTATMEGMKHLKRELELVSSARVAQGNMDIAILFGVDTTALKRDI